MATMGGEQWEMATMRRGRIPFLAWGSVSLGLGGNNGNGVVVRQPRRGSSIITAPSPFWHDGERE